MITSLGVASLCVWLSAFAAGEWDFQKLEGGGFVLGGGKVPTEAEQFMDPVNKVAEFKDENLDIQSNGREALVQCSDVTADELLLWRLLADYRIANGRGPAKYMLSAATVAKYHADNCNRRTDTSNCSTQSWLAPPPAGINYNSCCAASRVYTESDHCTVEKGREIIPGCLGQKTFTMSLKLTDPVEAFDEWMTNPKYGHQREVLLQRIHANDRDWYGYAVGIVGSCVSVVFAHLGDTCGEC